MLGYIIIGNENYEIAYLNWESKLAHELASQSPDGIAVFADAKEIMDVFMYQEALAVYYCTQYYCIIYLQQRGYNCLSI